MRLRARYLALLVFLISAILLMSSHSIAAPYPYLTMPASHIDIHASIVTEIPSAHPAVMAAAFGFQAAGSSIITVRTYDAPTGAILSEDSFDVNVKEEGATQQNQYKGRIFAGGIGIDPEGKSKFMLRVYDAETGRFLWEGQLNLLKADEEGMTRASFVLIQNDPTMVQTSFGFPEPLRTLFSIRALNPTTGRLVWQDQFAPGSRKGMKRDGVVFNVPSIRSIREPIDHIFDLNVRTYDRRTGTLLWEDSFEQLDRIEVPADEPEDQARPQAIPSWSTIGRIGGENHLTGLR